METTAHKIEAKERTSDVKLSEKIPFNKMLLSSGVRNGLHRAGYVYPTVLQANAIPIGKAGIDLIVQSKSGTGKTLIFTVVLLETIYDSAGQHPQALILAPTREIAIQIENTLNVLGSCCPGFKAVSVIGGLDVMADRKKIQNARAVVGTPGRVLHLIHNEVFNTSDIKLLVIDEADKMMTSMFRGDFEKIYNSLPAKKQIIACSATFCNELDTVLAKFMRNPFLISTEKRTTSLLGIKQLIYELPEEKTNILEMQAKVTALCQIFSNVAFKQCMVFSNSQSRAESYRSFLNKDGWPCEVITGGQDQKTRIDIFNKFREFKTRILVSTDLMARGIDSEHVNLVINLELPDDAATYLHRVGRAGRFGSHGIAISFMASRKDREKFRKLLDKIGFQMEILKFPKDRTVDLWNFNDPEEEKSLLGVFDLNDNTECEKENINNNCLNDIEVINCTDLNTKKNSLHNELKRDVLKHLIDLKSSKVITNRNGNLFSEFMEQTNFENVKVESSGENVEDQVSDSKSICYEVENIEERKKFINTSTQYSDKSSMHSDKSEKFVKGLICDAEKKKCVKSDLFDDFVSNGKQDSENEKDLGDERLKCESTPFECLKSEPVEEATNYETATKIEATSTARDTLRSKKESLKCSTVPQQEEMIIPEGRKKFNLENVKIESSGENIEESLSNSQHICDEVESIEEPKKLINTSKHYSNKSSINSDKSKKSLIGLICDVQEKKCLKSEIDLFDDFISHEKHDSENDKDLDEHLKNENSQSECLKSEPVEETTMYKTAPKIEATNTARDSLCSNKKSLECTTVPQQEEIIIPEDRKKSLHLFLLENKSSQKTDDIFEEFESLKQLESVSASSNVENKQDQLVSEPNSKQNKIKSPKTSKAKNNKRSKDAVKEAIREVHNNIVSSSESAAQLASLKSFSELQPSTSMQPFGPSTDNSDGSNYPNTSCPTSANQTNQDMFNISSLTEDGHVSFNTSDLNASTKQEADSATGPVQQIKSHSSSSSSTPGQSSTDVDSTTETASEQDESSGFDEEDSAASSGVITSETSSSSYNPSEGVTTSLTGTESSNLDTTECFDSSSDSDSDSTVASEKDKIRHRSKSKRQNANGKNINTIQVYQKAFTGWTELYWNQVSHIQDYVSFYKYAQQHASQYS